MTARNARLALVRPPAERAAASAERFEKIDAAIRDMAASCPVPGALRRLVERLGEPDARTLRPERGLEPGETRARKRG
jgi:hypothetical protein